MKVLCMMPIYGRHDVLPLTFAGLERLAKQMQSIYMELYVLVVASNKEDAKFTDDYWANKDLQVIIMHAENLPLGRKLNEGLEGATKIMDAFEIEWLMLSGCDNLFSPEYLPLAELKMIEPFGFPFFGFTNVAMYHKATGEAVEMVYPCASGVGRMHHISMLKRACDCHIAIAKRSLAGRFGSHGKGQRVYLPKSYTADPENYEIIGEAWHLWPDDTYSSTDIDSENWMMMSGYACHYIRTPEPVILDIKTGGNISKWEHFRDNKQNRRISDLGAWAEVNS